MPTPEAKRLTKLLKRLFPKAKRTHHPLGVLLAQPGRTQLVACNGGQHKPFDVLFTRQQWEKMFDAAAKTQAELAYALVDGLGIAARVLPLHAVAEQYPNWRTLEDANLFDEELGEYVHEEVVRVPLGVANLVALPEAQYSEYELQAVCVQWLKEAHPGVVVASIPNEYAHAKWRHAELSGALRGASDLVLCFPGGQVCFVEMKRPTGVLSEHQSAFGNRLRQNGGSYSVIRSVAAFQALVRKFTG